ncbi:unnamed protein product [Urochloa decumbens]|uniref:Uncharacterized protein n=1 Tax=Urochloa decumbens TaxID=240449 RepID=A0ABC9G7Z9_9POAL
MESSKVQMIESSLVAPSEASPTKALWLSPFDLALANRGHTPLVYLYSSGAAFFDAARLKEGMAKALAAFYPLAGRLGVDDAGRAQISCNGEGAFFVVARSHLKSDDLDFSKPSPELRRMFVPRIEPSSLIMAAQVTFLKCGAVALGVAVHHAAVDGPSTIHFMQTWSAFSRDALAAVELPCHDRTLLRARCPPAVHPGALSVLWTKVTFSEASGPTATEVFTISRDQLVTLKRLCGGATTFCSVSALVRSLRPPLPDRYFGNALVWLGVAAAARDVATEALASVAGRIGGARMDDKLVRSAIDHLELAGTAADGRPLRGSMPETELRITSWLGMPVYDADFGCGGPQVMSRAESVRGGFVYLMDQRGGGVRVVMCMEAANIKSFQRLLYANIAKASKL